MSLCCAPGRERLDLREGQRRVADVLHFTDVEASTHDLGDEDRLAFDGLKAGIGVEAALDDVAVDADLGVLI